METILVSNNNSYTLAEKVSYLLGMKLHILETHLFPDGEIISGYPFEECKHLIFIGNMYPDISASFLEFILFVRQAKARGVKKITAIMPYFIYSRSNNFEHILYILNHTGVDNIYTLDLHNYDKELSRNYNLHNISSCKKVAEEVLAHHQIDLLVAPDKGRESFVKALSDFVNVPYFALNKTRINGKCMMDKVPMNCNGKKILLIDDIVDSGSTLLAASQSLRDEGAQKINAFITHALGDPEIHFKKLSNVIDTLTITDSIASIGRNAFSNCRMVTMADVLYEEIFRIL